MGKKSLKKYRHSLSERFSAIKKICDDIHSTKSRKSASQVSSRENIERLNKLVSGDMPSTAYKLQENNIIKGLTGALSQKFNLKALAAEWPKTPESKKISLLERALKVQASLQSTHDIEVKAARLEIKPLKGSGSMKYNLGDRAGKRDRIIIAERHFNKNLSETLNTLAHEQTHILQVTLARAVSYKQIRASNPLYRDGLYFLLKDNYNAYVSSDIDEAYMLQRDEVDAYLVGDAIGDFVARFESKEVSEKKPGHSARKKHPQPALS